MIVCSCRAISNKDYSSPEELKERIFEDDVECGICQDDYKDFMDLLNIKDDLKSHKGIK